LVFSVLSREAVAVGGCRNLFAGISCVLVPTVHQLLAAKWWLQQRLVLS